MANAWPTGSFTSLGNVLYFVGTMVELRCAYSTLLEYSNTHGGLKSRRAGLDPHIEMNRPLLTRKADEVFDAACEAIAGQLAGQDPPYGSARNSPPEAAAACLKGSVSGTGVPERDDVPLRDMNRERSESVPGLGGTLSLSGASL